MVLARRAKLRQDELLRQRNDLAWFLAHDGFWELVPPDHFSQAEHEELASEHAARHDWIAQEGRQQREVHGLYHRRADFKVSTTDPDATPMWLKGGDTHLGYHTHYVVDGSKARIIL